jgi:hypothetical protein
MSWRLIAPNTWSNSNSPFIIKYDSVLSEYVVESIDGINQIPFSDIFNNPVFPIDFDNSVILASHFRGEAANTPGTPAHSFKTDIDTGIYRISNGKVGFSSNGSRVGEFGNGYGGFTGNIIQVLQTSIDTQLSTGSTSYVDITGLSVSITPKYTTSKILILFKLNGSNLATSSLNAYQIV